MMSDWQVGDLAVAIGPSGKLGAWTCEGAPPRGSINRIVGVVTRDRWVALVVAGYPSIHFTAGWDADCFRKIHPDEQEACEPEFAALLKRTKRTVQAEDSRNGIEWGGK